MPGVSLVPHPLSANVLVVLCGASYLKSCSAFSADFCMRAIPSYPDVMGICGSVTLTLNRSDPVTNHRVFV